MLLSCKRNVFNTEMWLKWKQLRIQVTVAVCKQWYKYINNINKLSKEENKNKLILLKNKLFYYSTVCEVVKLGSLSYKKWPK